MHLSLFLSICAFNEPCSRRPLFDRAVCLGCIRSASEEMYFQSQQGTGMFWPGLRLELQLSASHAGCVESVLEPSCLCKKGSLSQWIDLSRLGSVHLIGDPPVPFSKILLLLLTPHTGPVDRTIN